MTSKTPYEMAEEILGLAQALVLELGGHDSGPPGNAGKGKPVQVDLRAEVEEASADEDEPTDEAPGGERTGSRKLVGASWAPASWS